MMKLPQSPQQGEERYFGLTTTQLNLGFLAVVGSVIAAVCAWLFVFGGLSSITGGSDVRPVDDTAREISADALGRMALRPNLLPADYANFTANDANGPLTLDN